MRLEATVNMNRRDKKNGQLMLQNHDGHEKYGQLFYRHNFISN